LTLGFPYTEIMTLNIKYGIIFTALIAAFSFDVFAVEEGHDHALLSRIPNSGIETFYEADFSAFNFYNVDAKNTIHKITREGRLTQIYYQLKQATTALALARNIQYSLKASGFLLQASLSDDAINPIKAELERIIVKNAPLMIVLAPEYLYMTRKAASGVQHVAVVISSLNEDHFIYYLILEEKAQTFVPLKVSEKDIEKGLQENGKVEVYGIYFDVGNATIKPESSEALSAIDKILRADNKLTLYIVGHTDSTGDFSKNMRLSEQRAQAVLRKLTEEYAVDKNRLRAYGVGSLSPLGANSSEFGRAKNRRVELVQQ